MDRKVGFGLRLAVVAALTTTMLPGTPAGGRAKVPQTVSSPGQIKVVSVNAKQRKVLGLKRFTALFELGRTLRKRPTAFNGGLNDAVAAPDVVIVQEIRESNAEIFERLLQQRFAGKYRIVGEQHTASTIFVNIDTVERIDDASWPDACLGEEQGAGRHYSLARLRLLSTGSDFTVAGVHLAKNYAGSGGPFCHDDNVMELRNQLADETGPVIIGGDFNKRAVEARFECDPHERSETLPWWAEMTNSFDGNRAYVDAVRQWHRSHKRGLGSEWTHEQKRPGAGCSGEADDVTFRRSRIDYLFVSGAVIAEAHTDHPGWAGDKPGSRDPENFRYSDHRFVWGRFVLTGPPAPPAPLARPLKDGDIELTWGSIEGATSLILLRKVGVHAYDQRAALAPDSTSFTDRATEHGKKYRYALVAVDAEGGNGLESSAAEAVADSVGPDVMWVKPRVDAADVEPRTSIEIHLAEIVDPASVDRSSVTVARADNGRTVRGRTSLERPRHLVFRPAKRPKKGVRYRVVVSGLRDALGNRGPRFVWRFSVRPG